MINDQLLRARVRGSLLAGAAGDALGAPIEFKTLAEIRKEHGPAGLKDYASAYGRLGAITDDTQMTLFTAEGMLRGFVRARMRGIGPVYSSVTAHAYQRWLRTQQYHDHDDNDGGRSAGANAQQSRVAGAAEDDGWLITHPELHNRRAPGNTCISSLLGMRSFDERAANDSKGCGGVMRIAPVGLYFAPRYLNTKVSEILDQCFETARDIAAITHGHPTGQLSASFMACLVLLLAAGSKLQPAIEQCIQLLRKAPEHEETLEAVEMALDAAGQGAPTAEKLESLGAGWVAEEALSIALYSVLATDTLEAALILAINHSGDSDSTGAITGNLAGVLYSDGAIPERWLTSLELRNVIQEIADDLVSYPSWDVGQYSTSAECDHYWRKYPGH